MRGADGRSRWMSRLPLAVALAVVVAGCSSDPPPPEPERSSPTASPVPSQVPWSQELRYDPIDRSLCERMDWNGLAAELGTTFEDLGFEGDSGDFRTNAMCDLRLDESSGLVDTRGGIWVTVYRDTGFAYGAYRNGVGSERDDRWPTTVEAIDGWWDGGTYLEQYREAGYVKPRVHIDYHIYHANLHMWVWFRGRVVDLDRADAITLGHELATAMTDAAIGLVPCRPLNGAPPATHCDGP